MRNNKVAESQIIIKNKTAGPPTITTTTFDASAATGDNRGPNRNVRLPVIRVMGPSSPSPGVFGVKSVEATRNGLPHQTRFSRHLQHNTTLMGSRKKIKGSRGGEEQGVETREERCKEREEKEGNGYRRASEEGDGLCNAWDCRRGSKICPELIRLYKTANNGEEATYIRDRVNNYFFVFGRICPTSHKYLWKVFRARNDQQQTTRQ